MKTACAILTALLGSPALIAAEPAPGAGNPAASPRAAAGASQSTASVFVDCAGQQSLAEALDRNSAFMRLEVSFTGTCQEDLTIDRDQVTLRGADPTATLLGLIDVKGAAGVVLRDFLIRGVPGARFDLLRAGINVLEGAAASVVNMRLDGVRARGVQVFNASADLRDVTVLRVLLGAFYFRAAQVTLAGEIVGSDGGFGMSVQHSQIFARQADLTFENNFYGLLVQLNSGFEHVSGRLTTRTNAYGVVLGAQGVYAFGSFVTSRDNSIGILIDELSSLTPLIGAPGGGPSLTIADNAEAGIVMDRYSTLEVFQSTTITGNAVGLQVSNSQVRLANAQITGNSTADVILEFGARAELNGTGNVIGSPVQCDGTVLTRGSPSCGASLTASAQAASTLALRDSFFAIVRQAPVLP